MIIFILMPLLFFSFPTFANQNCADFLDPQYQNHFFVPSKNPPWPEVTEQMIQFLLNFATQGQSAQSTELRQVLEDAEKKPTAGLSQNDNIIHSIYAKKPFTEIWELYGTPENNIIKAIGINTIHYTPILPHTHSRIALAHSISALFSDELKIGWMQFLLKDPDTTVKFTAAFNALNHIASQEKLERLVEYYSGMPSTEQNGHVLKLAIARVLPRISPQRRFKLILRFQMDSSHEIVAAAKQALNSLVKEGDPDYEQKQTRLSAWFEDMRRIYQVIEILEKYHPDHQSERAFPFETIHNNMVFSAFNLVSGLTNRKLQKDWYQRFKALAVDSESKSHALAADFSSLMNLHEIAELYYQYLRNTQQTEDPEKRALYLGLMHDIAKNPRIKQFAGALIEIPEFERKKDLTQPDRRNSAPRLTQIHAMIDAWTEEDIAALKLSLGLSR